MSVISQFQQQDFFEFFLANDNYSTGTHDISNELEGTIMKKLNLL